MSEKLTNLNLTDSGIIYTLSLKFDKNKHYRFFEGLSDNINEDFKKEVIEYVLDLFSKGDADLYSELEYTEEQREKILDALHQEKEFDKLYNRQQLITAMLEGNKDNWNFITHSFINIFCDQLRDCLESEGFKVELKDGLLASHYPTIYLDKNDVAVLDKSIMNEDLRTIVVSMNNTTLSELDTKFIMNEFLSDTFDKDRYIDKIINWVNKSYRKSGTVTQLSQILDLL